LEWTGYARQDVEAGITATQVVVEEERRRLAEYTKMLLQGQQLQDKEFMVLRKDGTTFPVVTYSAPIMRHEKVVGFRVVSVDMSDRKLMEEMLRESESRFRAIFESAKDFIYIKDRHLKYTHVNPAMQKLFGLPVNKLVGKTDKNLFGSEAGKHLENLDVRVLEGHSIEEEHTRIVAGVPMTFLDTRVPIRASDGAITGLFGIARDVTGRSPKRINSPDAGLEYVSPKYLSTLERSRIAANSSSVLLITGETGSGKDYLAKYIHSKSGRSANPFLVLNCAAVTSSLAESELFGHEAGAFTGVKGRKRGLLELAEGGTLLLNEIGELSLELQAKLLTFLDTKKFHRVGGEKTVSVDARIITATNRDLKMEIENGRFRQDLFHRINVIPIEVPPLRERKEDIPIIAREILARVADEMGLREIPELTKESIDTLVLYDWPGNVRELRNALERSIMLSSDNRTLSVQLNPTDSHVDWSISVRFPDDRSIHEVGDEVKRALVVEALKRSEGKKAQAAELLGISRHAFKRLLKALTLTSGSRSCKDS
jgi:PAS domain S-box-containing protein